MVFIIQWDVIYHAIVQIASIGHQLETERQIEEQADGQTGRERGRQPDRQEEQLTVRFCHL